MTDSQAYEHLERSEKVRVNAVILNMMEQEPEFMKRVIEESGKLGHSERLPKSATIGEKGEARAEGFQHVIDALRDVLAKDKAHLPQIVDENDPKMRLNSTAYLGKQMELLRQVKDSLAHGITDTSNLMKVVENGMEHATFNDRKGYTLPFPKVEYKGADTLLAKAATFGACLSPSITPTPTAAAHQTAPNTPATGKGQGNAECVIR